MAKNDNVTIHPSSEHLRTRAKVMDETARATQRQQAARYRKLSRLFDEIAGVLEEDADS